MAINLQALSITSAFNAIVSFFKSQENNSRWKDLTTGAEGIFLIRMLANILSNISYRMITARRENYLSTANLQSSNLGIALNLGYSAYRGSNQKRLIEFTPNGDYVIPKFSVIGSYNDEYNIMNLEDIVLRDGIKQNIKTVIGNVRTVSFNAGTSKVQPFTRFETGISEDCILLLNGVEVPTSKVVRDLNRNMYLIRTNPYASVDILYLNNKASNTYKYGDESVFTLKYVELADVPTIDYSSSMFAFGTLNNTLTIEGYVPFESNASIKVNAPLDHEVQHLIRSKEDYSQRVKQIIPNVIQTSYTPITPTYTLISYLKDDYTTVKSPEIINLKTILEQENYFGTPLPDITIPRREVIDLDIKIAITDRLLDINDIQADIGNIIKTNYDILLNQTFDIYTMERLIEELSYVKWARVEYKAPEWTDITLKSLGQVIKNGDQYYKAGKILGTTGTVEPAWNIPQGLPPVGIGTETYGEDGTIVYIDTHDGDLVWRTYKRLDIDNITKWEAQDGHKIGDYVYTDTYPDYMFKCVDLYKYSGSATPDVSLVQEKDFVIDGNLVWVCILSNDSLDPRQPATHYKIGDQAQINGKSFEVVSYVGKTGYILPEFEQHSYEVTDYLLDDNENRIGFRVSGNKTPFFEEGDIVKTYYVNEDNNLDFMTFKVVESEATSNLYTTVRTQQMLPSDVSFTSVSATLRGTEDGDIYWELIDDIEKVSYDWNVYNSIYYDLEVK